MWLVWFDDHSFVAYIKHTNTDYHSTMYKSSKKNSKLLNISLKIKFICVAHFNNVAIIKENHLREDPTHRSIIATTLIQLGSTNRSSVQGCAIWHYCSILVEPGISTHWDWQVLTLLRPSLYTEEIRKWKQIRHMPQDCFHPRQIKWPQSVSVQSHVNHPDFTHVSKAGLQSQKRCFPVAPPDVMVELAPSSLRLKLLRYWSFPGNVRIQVKLFAVKKARGLS